MKNTIIHNGKRYICRIYDNGGVTLDRYTIALKAYRVNGQLVYPYLASSAYPFHSFGQHGESGVKIDGQHLGKRIPFESLPIDVQRFIVQNL